MGRRALYKGMKISNNSDYLERKASALFKLQHTVVPNVQYPYIQNTTITNSDVKCPKVVHKELPKKANNICIFYDASVSFS